MLILIFFVKITPESLLHQVRIQQFWKRGPRLLFANLYPIYIWKKMRSRFDIFFFNVPKCLGAELSFSTGGELSCFRGPHARRIVEKKVPFVVIYAITEWNSDSTCTVWQTSIYRLSDTLQAKLYIRNIKRCLRKAAIAVCITLNDV
jgi:hypothetical protein